MSPQTLCSTILLITGALVRESFQRRDFYITMTKCELTATDSRLSDTNCTISKKDGIEQITAYSNHLQDTKTIGIAMEISMKPPGRDYFTMINITIENICPYLNGNARGNIVLLMVDEMVKMGKMPKCPVKKDVYYIKDYYLSPDHLPPYVPEAGYRIYGGFLGVFNGTRQYLLKFLIMGNIEPKRTPFWKVKY